MAVKDKDTACSKVGISDATLLFYKKSLGTDWSHPGSLPLYTLKVSFIMKSCLKKYLFHGIVGHPCSADKSQDGLDVR